MENTPQAPANQPASAAGKNQNTAVAAIAYVLFFVPLLTGDAKKDAFVNYHVKQGLVLFLLAVALKIIDEILPFYLWSGINAILNLGVLVLMIMGIVNAANGKREPLPIIGKFSEYFMF